MDVTADRQRHHVFRTTPTSQTSAKTVPDGAGGASSSVNTMTPEERAITNFRHRERSRGSLSRASARSRVHESCGENGSSAGRGRDIDGTVRSSIGRCQQHARRIQCTEAGGRGLCVGTSMLAARMCVTMIVQRVHVVVRQLCAASALRVASVRLSTSRHRLRRFPISTVSRFLRLFLLVVTLSQPARAQSVMQYNHTLTTLPLSEAYDGGVYAPTLNRIYFVPSRQASAVGKNWHYIDGSDGTVMEYIHTLTTLPVSTAYSGGVYAQTLNRIYFVPSGQAGATGKNWHYIDGSNGAVVEYTHTLAVSTPYKGGVYAQTLNRIYFVPHSSSTSKNWHYVDGSNGAVVEYTHTLITLPVGGAYFGGVYAPTLNRIYFVPLEQAGATGKNWHYIDGSNGTVNEYTHTLTTLPVVYAYVDGVYAPTLDRIYFVPWLQANAAGKNWHYIDGSNGAVVEYTHTLVTLPVGGAYIGGVYAPTLDRIYFVPIGQAGATGKNWHYIDGSNGTVNEYTHTLTTMPTGSAYYGGVYAPTLNRIYFAPYRQASAAGKNWHYISARPLTVMTTTLVTASPTTTVTTTPATTPAPTTTGATTPATTPAVTTIAATTPATSPATSPAPTTTAATAPATYISSSNNYCHHNSSSSSSNC